ncbi:AraC-type DNA-binding protein [Chitinophaga rupis]|uniref:AraC-type DNA-binding protein n=1 Tax=Chitinophaga rupis TaxID=573321 RepID=A0A1H8B500_9BACT|nr:helix-turn-helix domain-containing protein [Chitinophaga rupis]SEM77379.1 AraC-type DNA-binding protein [Chitinophaga rupis]
MSGNALELIDPQRKSLVFKVYAFEDDAYFSSLKKYNYFSVILVTKGKGMVTADLSQYPFDGACLICFSLYQPFKIKSEGVFQGVMVNFHPDFFCLHKHRNEVSCNGVLFNNIYDSPVTALAKDETELLLSTINGLKLELQSTGIAQTEVLISYLKILLINGSRIKLFQQQTEDASITKTPVILDTLKNAIEEHFSSLHSAGEYADLLNISTAALNRVCKTHFNKTLSHLISDRIIIEAKRQLYLTDKPVKQIAYELGFNDEFYFSRFFKNHVAISPQFFRDTIGFNQANA